MFSLRRRFCAGEKRRGDEMRTPRIQFPFLLFHFLLVLQVSNGTQSTIVFGTVGRSRYTFDIFSLPSPLRRSSSSSYYHSEHQITDGQSVNYNGFYPTNTSHLISLLQSPTLEGYQHHHLHKSIVYVSERHGVPNLYLDVFGRDTGGGDLEISLPTTHSRILHLPLLPSDVSMKDRPTITGEQIVYVSTHEDPKVPRQSWASVYSTHISTGETKRLTPKGVADFSPTVSPSGEWTAVASLGEKGWAGEVDELNTDVFVFRTVDGSERVKVADHGGWPSWSDDSTLYFHCRSSEDGWWSIYRVSFGTNLDVLAVERVTPPGFHAFTPAAGDGFIVMATRRPKSDFRHIEVLDLHSNLFVEITKPVSPTFHHYNPFVSRDTGQIGYHRCRGVTGVDDTTDVAGPLQLESIKSQMPETNLFRIDGDFPTFSPDGTRIAYVGLPGLFVINSDGSGKQEILSGNAFATAWDWKRKDVIYTSYGPTFASESTKVDIISITLNGELQEGTEFSVSTTTPSLSIKKLTTGGKNNAFPSPSPDGKWVVFRSGRSGHKNLYIMDALEGEGASLRQLTNGPWTDTMCNWSPDGEWIAFASDRDNPGGGSFAIYFIHPNGTGLRNVVHSGEGGRTNHPFFSPDSKRFVFTTDYAGISAEPISNPHQYQPYGDIFTASIDGSDLRRLTHNSYEDGTPTWGSWFMEAADVPESISEDSLCSFDDCHWLALQIREETQQHKHLNREHQRMEDCEVRDDFVSERRIQYSSPSCPSS